MASPVKKNMAATLSWIMFFASWIIKVYLIGNVLLIATRTRKRNENNTRRIKAQIQASCSIQQRWWWWDETRTNKNGSLLHSVSRRWVVTVVANFSSQVEREFFASAGQRIVEAGTKTTASLYKKAAQHSLQQRKNGTGWIEVFFSAGFMITKK